MANRSEFHVGETELVVLGLIAAGIWIFSRGGITNAAIAAGEAAVGAISDAASGAASGVVGAIGSGVGLPKPSQTTDDPYIARWIMDQPKGGRFEASKWATSSAFINAFTIDAGNGAAPAHDSPLWAMFGDTFDMDYGTAAPGDW